MPGLPPPSLLRPGNVPLSQLVLPEQSENCGTSLDDFFKSADREPHTWTACTGTAFKVRCGPNYKEKRKKKPSAQSLYEVFAIDVYSSESKLPHIGRVAMLPEDAAQSEACGLPPYVIINWMVPNYPPSGMLGPKRTNGPGWNLVLYCRLSQRLRSVPTQPPAPSAAPPQQRLPPAQPPPAEQVAQPPPLQPPLQPPQPPLQPPQQPPPTPPPQLPAVDLLRRFMHPTEGARLRGERLKCIMGLADTEKPAFNLLLKKAIVHNNFKPFLSKTASFCYTGRGYFEIDIDIHMWGTAPLSAFNTVKGSLPSMLLRAGCLIEAADDAEMPENMLAAACVTHLDPSRAQPIAPEIVAYLNDPANHEPHLERQGRRSAGSKERPLRASHDEDLLSCEAPNSDPGGDSPVEDAEGIASSTPPRGEDGQVWPVTASFAPPTSGLADLSDSTAEPMLTSTELQTPPPLLPDESKSVPGPPSTRR